jgi:hypothetical protein
MSESVLGTFSRKSGFTIVKISLKKNGEPGKRNLKYVGKEAANKDEYDQLSIEQVMQEIREDLTAEFNKEISLKLTTVRSGRIYLMTPS